MRDRGAYPKLAKAAATKARRPGDGKFPPVPYFGGGPGKKRKPSRSDDRPVTQDEMNRRQYV